MAWNENSNKNKEEGPPNLDEVLKQLQKKLQGLFGGGKSRPDVNLGGSLSSKKNGMGLAIAVVGVVYLLTGIYIVEQPERAVITRFGRYVRTEQPGPHWIPRLIESKQVVNVDAVKTTTHKGQMLTKDENIVSAEIAVQYRISDLREYFYNTVDPERTLQQISESALRQVVGQTSLNDILTTGRALVVSEARKVIQSSLDYYKCGLIISDLALQQTKAPEQVKEAFDDAIKAQQDQDRFINEAETYARKRIPEAEGQAKRLEQESQAYSEEVVLRAKGDVARFNKLLPEYRHAPQVTRERMYFETLEKIYGDANKVFVDMQGNQNLIYLPIEKMMNSVNHNQVQHRSEVRLPDMNTHTEQFKVVENTVDTSTHSRPLYRDIQRTPRTSKGEE